MKETATKSNMNMMKLEEIIGDRIMLTIEEGLTPEERQTVNEQSALVVNLAKQFINAADWALRTEKLHAQTGQLEHSCSMKLLKGEE